MDKHDWDERYAATALLWSAEPNRFLEPEVRDLPPGRALDIACGEGRNAIWLAEQGWQVTGVDFSTVAIEKARSLAHSRGLSGTWLVADVVREPITAATFDLVLLFYLQLVAEERRTVLRWAADALTEGGVLLLVAHDSSNLERGWGGPRDPSVLYSPEEVVSDLEDRLAIDRAERVERPVETQEGVRMAIDVLVRAHRPRPTRPSSGGR